VGYPVPFQLSPPLIAALKFRTDDPQVVHVFTAHGAETGGDAAGGALSFAGVSSRLRAHDRLGQFDPGIVIALRDLPHEGAFAGGFVDGGAGASAQADQRATVGTTRIKHRAPAGAAGSGGHSPLVAERSIRTHGSAVEPRGVIELAGLHVEADGDEARIAERVGRRPSAGAAAEIARDAFVRQDEDGAVLVMIAVEGTIAVTVMIAVLAVMIAVLIVILRRGERNHRDHEENCEDRRYLRRSSLPHVPAV
jgi:hypothetical protein